MNNFNNFLKSTHKYSDQLYYNTKKTGQVMFDELIKYDSKSTLSKQIFELIRNYENYMIKVKGLITYFYKINKVS